MFLKNIKVEFISLVHKGANRKQVIWKSASSTPPQLREIPIAKTDEEKRLVYGIVYAPDEVDTQGDYTDASQIEKAAHAFMKAGLVGNVDKDHSFQAEEGAYVAESWIVKDGDPVFPNEEPGSWAVAIKIEDDGLWEKIKKDEIGGLSMGGVADKVRKEDGSQPAILSKIKRLIKGEESDMDENKVKEIAEATVTAAIEKIDKPLGKDDLVSIVGSAIKSVVDPIEARLQKIEKQSPGSGQGEGTIDGTVDHEALAAEIVKSIQPNQG